MPIIPFITFFSLLLASGSAFTFPAPTKRHPAQIPHVSFRLSASSSSVTTNTIIDRSTLTLLEHINLDIPSHEYAIPFYYHILGCGVDPRMAGNFTSSPEVESTIWANCGASQFHLCYNPDSPPKSPGKIALRYDSLDALKERIEQHCTEIEEESSRCFKAVEYGQDTQGKPQVTITDRYDNVFVCRTNPSMDQPTRKQPLLSNESPDWPKTLSHTPLPNDCQGLDYLEIPCPPNTAEKIANFYESVFDATTTVVPISETSKIAMVAFGNIQSTGRAEQYLLFQEQTNYAPSSNTNNQYHIALYVGETQSDFEQAYKNAEMANIVWINPRFADKVDTLEAAREWKQFRFKDVIDLETGMGILELEHEIRSIEHASWPQQSQPSTPEEEEEEEEA